MDKNKYEQLKKNLKHLSNMYDGIIGATLDAARLAIIDLQESIETTESAQAAKES